MSQWRERFSPVDVIVFVWFGLYIAHLEDQWVETGVGVTLAVCFIALFHDIKKKPTAKEKTHD